MGRSLQCSCIRTRILTRSSLLNLDRHVRAVARTKVAELGIAAEVRGQGSVERHGTRAVDCALARSNSRRVERRHREVGVAPENHAPLHFAPDRRLADKVAEVDDDFGRTRFLGKAFPELSVLRIHRERILSEVRKRRGGIGRIGGSTARLDSVVRLPQPASV